MKKLIKKILTTLCAITLCVLCLTGCSWLQIDKARYYDEVVVTIGNKEAITKEFTKKDLIEAFSNYGYQYYQSYGYSLEESVNQTIKSMVDRSLLMDVVKKEIDGSETYKFTDKEKLEIRKQVFDYMQDSIDTFETKIKTEWNMDVETEEESSIEPLRKAEESYTPTTKYEIVTDPTTGITTTQVTRVEEDTESIDVPSDLPEHFSKSYTVVQNEKVSNEAWTRYIKSLQDLAKAEGRSTKEEDVLLYEEERLTNLMLNNKYLDKYEKKFFDNTPVNVEAVLNYYREQYKSQMEQYKSSEKLYQTAMESASSNYIYYHLDNNDSSSVKNKYVNVKHILINFTQQQKDEISTLNTLYGITSDNTEANEEKKKNPDYQAQLKRIANRTTSTFEMSEEMYLNYGSKYNFQRVVGKENTYTASASDIYNFVKEYADGVNLKEKCTNFNELVYVFNDDSGFMNSEFDYVVNLDTSITDKMVKPFADGVRALDKSNGGEGAGSMDMIISEYGYHIIFHAGVAENIVDANNIDNISDENLLYLLCTNTTTPESNKSIFNYIYDKLKLDENLYNNMTTQVVENERTALKANNYVITYYEKRYQDLWK